MPFHKKVGNDDDPVFIAPSPKNKSQTYEDLRRALKNNSANVVQVKTRSRSLSTNSVTEELFSGICFIQ